MTTLRIVEAGMVGVSASDSWCRCEFRPTAPLRRFGHHR